MKQKIEFTPNPAQERFLRARRKGGTLLLCSGVGVGKTYVLSYVAFWLAWKNPGVRGLVVSHILSHVRTEIIPPLVDFLRRSGLYAGETKQDRVIHLAHGGAIFFGSADRKDSLEGKNVGWIVGDEVRYWSRESYERATARVRQKGAQYPAQIFTSTPEMNWMYDEFADRDDRTVIHAETSENKANLQAGYYERLRASLSKQAWETYGRGQWMSSSGSVYGEEFDENETIQPLEYVPGIPVDIGMDPGVVAPAVVFSQHLPYCHKHGVKDCLHVLDEIVVDDTPLVKMLALIADKMARRGWKKNRVFLDPFGGNSRDQVYGLKVSEVLETAGFDVVFSYDPVETNILNGIESVRSRLFNVDGQRRLFIDTALKQNATSSRNLTRAFAGYRWPERKTGQAAKNNPVHDETSHVMDALRYTVVNLFSAGGVKIL